MVEFQLLKVYGIGSPKNIGDNKMSMQVNIKVGVVGVPDEPRYRLPESTQVYEWDKSLTTTQAEQNMIAWAIQWVNDNYTIN